MIDAIRLHPWTVEKFREQYAWHLYGRHTHNGWLTIRGEL